MAGHVGADTPGLHSLSIVHLGDMPHGRQVLATRPNEQGSSVGEIRWFGALTYAESKAPSDVIEQAERSSTGTSADMGQ